MRKLLTASLTSALLIFGNVAAANATTDTAGDNAVVAIETPQKAPSLEDAVYSAKAHLASAEINVKHLEGWVRYYDVTIKNTNITKGNVEKSVKSAKSAIKSEQDIIKKGPSATKAWTNEIKMKSVHVADNARYIKNLSNNRTGRINYYSLSNTDKERVISYLVAGMVNEYRAQAGLNRLPMSDFHNNKSHAWSKVMANKNKLHHDLRRAGDSSGGENVIVTNRWHTGDDPYRIARHITQEFINSPGHHLGFLDRNVVGQGVGIVFKGDDIWGTWRSYTPYGKPFVKSGSYMPGGLTREITGLSLTAMTPKYTGVDLRTGKVTKWGNKIKKKYDWTRGVKWRAPQGIKLTNRTNAEITNAKAVANKHAASLKKSQNSLNIWTTMIKEAPKNIAKHNKTIANAPKQIAQLTDNIKAYQVQLNLHKGKLVQAQKAVVEAQKALADAERKLAEAKKAP